MPRSRRRFRPPTFRAPDVFLRHRVACRHDAHAAAVPRVVVVAFVFGFSVGPISAETNRATQTAVDSTVAISDEDRRFFENKIRPVLVKRCYQCHSSTSGELEGGLAVDSPSGLRLGGQSGPAVSAEAPSESLLLDAIRYDGIEMPPDAPLPEAVVHDFVTWVRRGAPDPRTVKPKAGTPGSGNSASDSENSESDTAGDVGSAKWWSFRRTEDPAVPAVDASEWPRDPIDRFVLAKIEAAGITPTRDAEPEVLLRRLTVDLTGLPPTAGDRDVFLSDYAGDRRTAVVRLVDRLLASPAFGERWGRHWLDVARYGESNGNDGLSRNPTFPHAWRYRDYVIDAFNEDFPYDRFVTEQVAGDLLPYDTPEQHDRQRIATGFLALGAKPAKAMNKNFEMDVVADQIDVVGTAILGLSVACARCHDHKHDPIPTRDYYALAGIFSSTETMWGAAANEKLTAPKTPLHELKAARSAAPVDAQAGQDQARDADAGSAVALAMGVRDGKTIADCKINIQGESGKLGPKVPRGFLSAYESLSSDPGIGGDSSGRLELARWLTREDHPHTARVIVNRVWLHLFGQAIVATPDDFGVYGAQPSHPELLDHLATRFRRDGWSIKRLIRAIALSRTYQLSSWCDDDVHRADPANRLYARHLRRRLDAESLRDSVLQVSGALDRRPGQGSAVAHLDVLVNKHDSLHRPSPHRSIYLCMLRNSPPPDLAAFDLPDGRRPQGSRGETTLPTQALFLLNNPLLVESSRRFAARLLDEPNATMNTRVRAAFRQALQRDPTDDELAATVTLVRTLMAELADEASSLAEGGGGAEGETADPPRSELDAWATVCQALLATNEFRYLD